VSVKIRLKRMGSKKKPFYRIIAADSRSPRDGRFIETLGYYNPMMNPPDVKLHEDALYKWMERGALPTSNTEGILRKVGFMQKWQLFKQGVKREDIDAQVGERILEPTKPRPAKAKVPEKPAEEAKPVKEAKTVEPAKSAEPEKPEEPKKPASESADAPAKPAEEDAGESK
jgi:small subunit ribosomal protein S16